MKHPGLVTAIMILLVATVVAAPVAWSDYKYGPATWAREARLEEPTAIGSADVRSIKLSKLIDESERDGQGLDKLDTIIEGRSDNPSGALLPIPYRQWLQEQTDPWWAGLIRN